MSRIGKMPIEVPAGVDVSVEKENIRMKGPKGELSVALSPQVSVTYDGDKRQIVCERKSDEKTDRALHGLTRALIANMIEGVTSQFQKKLQINGLGYTCQVTGDVLSLQVGFSHQVDLRIPDGIEVICPTNRSMVVTGVDKQKVGQFAAEIRGIRPPEPYNLKGIKYEDEVIKKKAGKTFVSGGG